MDRSEKRIGFCRKMVGFFDINEIFRISRNEFGV